jgi:hypothetical protein
MKNMSTGELKYFFFNPEEFSFGRSVNFAEISAPGMSYPLTQYVSGSAREFPVDFYFHNKPCTGVIEAYKNYIESFVPPEDNSMFFKPPIMLFCMGTFVKKCVVNSYEVKITEFDTNMKPTVAHISIQLRQVSA